VGPRAAIPPHPTSFAPSETLRATHRVLTQPNARAERLTSTHGRSRIAPHPVAYDLFRAAKAFRADFYKSHSGVYKSVVEICNFNREDSMP
jgi:hypothetical protein